MTLVQQTLERNQKNRVRRNRKITADLIETLRSRCRKMQADNKITTAVLHGSVLEPEFFRSNSDIDLVLGGVNPADSWKVTAEIGRDLAYPLDVQFLEDLPEKRAQRIFREGRRLV